MKKALWGLGIVVAGAGLFALGWFSHGAAGKSSVSSNGSPMPLPPPGSRAMMPPQQPRAPFVSQSDFQQLRAARDAVLQANPDLAAEYKQIVSDLQTQQQELDAAMIKADPKVAPIIAKLAAMRQHNGMRAPATAPGLH